MENDEIPDIDLKKVAIEGKEEIIDNRMKNIEDNSIQCVVTSPP